ncbi:MAG: hypothetical protein WBV36_02275 [Terriglobales bacterium]
MKTNRGMAYWIVFAGVQMAGFVSFSFFNVHTSIAPLFTGVFFLLPGGVLTLLVDLPFAALASIIVVVNFVAWSGLKKWGGAEWK